MSLPPITPTQESRTTSRLNFDYLTLRKTLGILGLALPVALIIGNDFTIEPSISHYYYTSMIVVFTGILFAFGLVLMAYRGFPTEENEMMSDNLITNLAGGLAILVAIIPTSGEIGSEGVPNFHESDVINAIHLGFAGMFICLMGYMSVFQFTKEKKQLSDPSLNFTQAEVNRIVKRVNLYRICGVLIWLSVAYIALAKYVGFNLTGADTFWGETVALICFGIAWLVKSKALSKVGL